MSNQPLIIGHRGAAAVAPENTLVSFARALDDGADGIEFDVRLAKNNVPVVIHDANLRRTGLRDGLVTDLSSLELNETDVGTWFNRRHAAMARPEYATATVPTLARVFELMAKRAALLYVEMKCALQESRALATSVAQLIRDYSLVARVVVESFTLEAIAEVKRIAPEIRTAALFEPKLSRPVPSKHALVAEAVRYGADEIALHRALATRRAVAEARRHNLNTVVWTVDNPLWMERAVGYGIHALISNNPALMCARRAEMDG